MELKYDIRLIRATEHSVIRQMLYHAIFVPPGESAPSRDIVDTAPLARVWQDWGRIGDLALVAVLDQHAQGSGHRIIGSAWMRLFPASAPGYGFVAEDVPELGVAVLPEYRGQGVGTALLRALISRASALGHPAVSLSVDQRNPALRLYERPGFSVVSARESTTMVLEL